MKDSYHAVSVFSRSEKTLTAWKVSSETVECDSGQECLFVKESL